MLLRAVTSLMHLWSVLFYCVLVILHDLDMPLMFFPLIKHWRTFYFDHLGLGLLLIIQILFGKLNQF